MVLVCSARRMEVCFDAAVVVRDLKRGIGGDDAMTGSYEGWLHDANSSAIANIRIPLSSFSSPLTEIAS